MPSRASRPPIRRAGITKIGSSTRASRVIGQEMVSIAIRARISETTLPTTPDSVSEKARWAPITSLFSRLTRAPVRVRVKKAIGICCTWSNTARRRSRIRPSPIRAESQRETSADAGLGHRDDGDDSGQASARSGTAAG